MSVGTQSGGAVISQNYDALFHDWELREARALIWKARQQSIHLRSESVEDLLQECLIHWYFMKERYDREKNATKKTFMNRIVQNKLNDLVRLIDANKRKISYLSETLRAIEMEEEKGMTNIEQILVDCDVLEQMSAAELPSVLSQAMSHLSFRQKKLCGYLREGINLTQACQKMGIPRRTMRDEVKRIQEVFRRYGLEEYLS